MAQKVSYVADLGFGLSHQRALRGLELGGHSRRSKSLREVRDCSSSVAALSQLLIIFCLDVEFVQVLLQSFAPDLVRSLSLARR